MIIHKNSSKIFQISLVSLVGASLVVSCSKDGSSLIPENGSKISADPQPKLTVNIPFPQIEAKFKTEKEQSISIKNDGIEQVKNIVLQGFEEPLTVAEGSNNCIDKTLQPGESCEVKLTFKPTIVGNDKKTIAISYNNDVGTKSKNQSFEVNYLGRGNINLDIPTLPQLKAELGKSDTKKLVITNKGEEDAKGFKLSKLTEPLLSSTTCSDVLEKGTSCEVEVTFSPKEIQSNSQKLEIRYNDIATTGFVTVTKETQISFAAIGKANLTVDVGQGKLIANVDKTKTRTIKVTNKGNGPATKIEVASTVGVLSITSDTCSKEASLEANKSCEIKLTFDPKSQIIEDSQPISIKYKDGVKDTSTFGTLNYKSVAREVLNLSDYIVSNASLELDTSCTKKEIYGNGLQSIPLAPNFTAIDDNGKPITRFATEDLLAATQIQVRDAGMDHPIKPGSSYNSNEVITAKTDYTKCIESSLSGDSIPDKGLFYKTSAEGQTVVLGAQVQYVDRNGVIHNPVKTADSGRRSIAVLSNPLSAASPSSLFSIIRTAEDYDGALVTRDNYRVFKISPDTKSYPSLDNKVKIFQIRITNKDTNQGSGILPVNYTESQVTSGNKYLMPIAYFDQSRGGIGEYKRNFYSGFFISGKNKPSSAQTILMHKDTDKTLTLNDISSTDFAIATISDSGMPGFVWKYQWDVDFLLELNGTDSYGNAFEGQVNSKF